MSRARPRLEALLWVATVRVLLSFLSLHQVLRLIERLVPLRVEGQQGAPELEFLGGALEATRRFVPRATCLPLAVAAMGLCRRFGLDPVLHLGMAALTNPTEKPRAHAWVECKDTVVVGGDVREQEHLGHIRFDGAPSPK